MNEHEKKQLALIPADKIPFVWMPCGCIGIKLDGDNYISFWDCDSDYDGPSVCPRHRTHNPMSDYNPEYWDDGRRKFRPFEPIPVERFVELIDTLQRQAHLADRMSKLLNLLAIPQP